ncbi:hypothetical protein GQ457_05G030160 [Hibiscus cannabinus]
MAPISAIVYYDGDYTGDDCGENFESPNFVLLKFIARTTFEALISKIIRLVPSSNTKTLNTLYYRFQTSMVPVSYATMTIQSQEDVEAMVDTHRGNGADMCELYADFQLRSSSRSSYQDFPPSLSTPSFQQFEHGSSSTQPPRQSSANFRDMQIGQSSANLSMGRHSCAAAFDLNIQPYDNRHGFSGHTTFESDPTLTLGHEGYSSPEEPIQELGPDGSEIGLFTTPLDANADVDSDSTTDEDNAEQDQPRTSTWEQHHASTSRGHQPYEPPSHMYNVDMVAFDVPEFPEMPNLGFNASYVGLDDSELWIGMQFETIDQAKSAIKLYNIRKSVHSKVTRSTSEKYVCECTQRKEQGCNWKVRVSKKKRKQNIWELSVYNGPHTCCAVGHRQDHPNLDSTIISQTVQPIVQASPKVTVSTLMAHVKSVYQYEPEYKKTWRAKDKALKKLHGDWDASYNELPGWINIMQKYNPGTIAVLETKPYYKNDRVVADVRQFHRLFWTFPQCIHAFKNCKPIIQIDGTFLFGRYRHVLLLAVIQDGNRKTIPVAFALVPREDTDSCKFFLQNLRKHFFRHNTVCLISDRGSGFLSAIESLGSRFCSPKVEHRYCLRHIASNYHGRYKKDYERKLILRMGYELVPNKFEEMLHELNERNSDGYNYIAGIPKEKWTNAYDGGFRYGHMTTNLAEAINSSLKGIRNLPISAIVKATYFRLGKLFATLGKESFTLKDVGHIFHPRIQNEIQAIVVKSNGLYVLPMSRSDTIFRVSEIPRPLQGYDPTSYRVNLEDKWCDCGYFQALKSPCQHAIAACSNSRRDYKNLVDPVYFLHSVCKVYEMEFPAIGSETEWHGNQTWPTILPDPQIRRNKSGRPTSTRIHNAMDMPQRERTAISLSSTISFLLMGISLVAAAPRCYDTGNFTTNSTYAKNRDLILASLPPNASANGGFFNTSVGLNSDQVYALAMCRGDFTPDHCYSCVNSTIYDLMTSCPNQKEAWAVDPCVVHYANHSFFGTLVLDPLEAGYNIGNITSNITAFDTVWESLVVSVCTPDLSHQDCDYCLRQSTAFYNSCCHGKQGGYVRFPTCYFRWDLYPFYVANASTDPTLSPPSTPGSPPIITKGEGSDEKKTSIWVPLGASLSAALGLALFFACGFFIWKRRNFQEDKHDSGEVQLLNLMVGSVPHENSSENFNLDNVGRSQEFPSIQFDILQAATNSFCDENKLGQGGFGPVYKGTLADGKEIAVKRLSRTSGQGLLEFKNEIMLIARLQHRNLVRLLGCCLEKNEMLLIYEFMPNKSLDVFLFNSSLAVQLTWQKRFNVIRGTARDFGMAKIFGGDQNEANTNRVVGTYGYMAPEYAMEGLFSVKSDVFSFGVLLLEIISGKRNSGFHSSEYGESLLTFAWKLWSKGEAMKLIEEHLVDSSVPTEVLKCIQIGLLCVQADPVDRPTMSSVVAMLVNDTITLPLPAEPAFYVRRFVAVPIQPNSSVRTCSVNEVTISNMSPR